MVLESIYRHRIPQPLESIGFCLNSSFELTYCVRTPPLGYLSSKPCP